MLKKQVAEDNKPELNLREQHLLKYSVLRPDMTLEEIKALFPEQFGDVKSINEIKTIKGSFLDKIKRGDINLGWKDFSAWLIYQIWGCLASQNSLTSHLKITTIETLAKKLKIDFIDSKLSLMMKNLDHELVRKRLEGIRKKFLDLTFAREHSDRCSEIMKKLNGNEAFAEARDNRLRVFNADSEFSKRRLEGIRKKFLDHDFANAHAERRRARNLEYEFNKKSIERLMKMNSDPNFARLKVIRSRALMTKLNADSEFKKKSKEWMKELNSRSEFAKKRDERIRSKEMKEIVRENWSNPEKRLRMLNAIQLSPNKLEINFHEYFKDKIKFTGDRQFWICFDVKYTSGDKAGKNVYKNPDFKVNEQKKVIELYGDYWHQNDDPLELMINYRNAGYKCLIFWEYDIKNHMKEVIELTNLFIDAQTEEDWKLVEEKQFEFLARAEAYLKNKKAKKQSVISQAS